MRCTIAVPVMLVLGWVFPLRAQDASDLIDRGVDAYHALELDAATQLLRQGLDEAEVDGVADSTRVRAHIFLGAIAVLRQQTHNAESEFRATLAIDPHARPDPLTFPPEITNAFASVQRSSSVVRAVARDTTILPGSGFWTVRVHANRMHRITVDIEQDGRSVRRLHEGAMGDSIELRWDGLDETGEPVAGDLVLHIAAEASSSPSHELRVPLEAELIRADTLVPPPPPRDVVQYEPPSPGPGSFQRLAAGILTGVGVALVLPAVTDSDGSTARYAIGGTFAVAGVIGFFADLSGRETTAIAMPDPVVQAAWNREVEEVRRENERLRRDVKLRITASPDANR